MLILSLDSSTKGCSAALHQDGALLSACDLHTDRSSSSMLTTLIQSTVQNAGFALHDLDAIAVAKGPGSYTGLRVAVSTAKGLCYALDKPLIGINTLAAMARQLSTFYEDNASTQGYLLCPMLDARRMEVYATVFDTRLQTILPTQAVVVQADSFGTLLEKYPIVFFGDGAAKCQPVLGTHPHAHFLSEPLHPSARTVGTLATEAFLRAEFEDVVTFEPYYLKDFMGTQPRSLPTDSAQAVDA
ncbi:tRNA (adenosine(37)-N6)-threonylcarbamoyltransferase complex dimerization subunit type 1 TsaB [Rhabdobacter roseus]|uniref:tRNA threonylcarbamoyladenosine biosynthesis protein TsaB n=1 Tax=Rhabdobacter roseus TaxID=1655419 RepID=A0A840THP8_9BACT|nr:tRNA (adenosine(37)-N6)-threonylcarbamoyltransferase complex dimerization subunit type 1 TsaB [Rhabdobacter roseus]MBB5282475.1 tRNA threonylcarbamoyladenosine biosynthesis protein TsaB [Rhabdobacter roseus]